MFTFAKLSGWSCFEKGQVIRLVIFHRDKKQPFRNPPLKGFFVLPYIQSKSHYFNPSPITTT